MDTKQVIAALEKYFNIKLSVSGFLRYVNDCMIAKPQRGGGGPGGKWTIFPDGTLEEAYAAWSLLHGEYGTELERSVFGGSMPKITTEAIAFIRWDIIFDADIGGYPIVPDSADNKLIESIMISRKDEYSEKPISIPEETRIWLRIKWAEQFLFAHNRIKSLG